MDVEFQYIKLFCTPDRNEDCTLLPRTAVMPCGYHLQRRRFDAAVVGNK
jgi:hypothetical protein